ncbi:FkbM family methyltransferase [Cuniculiplasma divulgatum]|uniref:FkbM family methyltransferase n=2 Tax=Cuniculiplasma divulgatum TaxID=1673428 RepID=A0A1R4A7W5_9ARCH|nr:FkbM family methyltransferase [Cuniculiplasma divulgatum]
MNYRFYTTFKKKYGIKFNRWRIHMEILKDPEMYLKFIPDNGDVIIDVGAQYGDYAILWAKKFRSKVLAFEPLKANFMEMMRDCVINNVDVIPINSLLGDGEPLQYKIGGNMIINSLDGEHDKKYETTKLDDFVLFFRIKPSIIKIDVEGFELPVLQGSAKTLQQYHPKIIIETHSKQLRVKCHEFLTSQGYTLFYEGRKTTGKEWMD